MYKVCFIIPYFGEVPTYFLYFVESLRYNPTYDWLIISDSKCISNKPDNVRWIEISFSEFSRIIQSKFDFSISLEKPYKLCDFKCAYGFLFDEYLRGYDYWGYCDIDLIFGNISKFVDLNILSEYDKIGHLGHFSIYKNNEKIKMLFSEGDYFKTVFSTPDIFVFDEWNEISINRIIERKNLKLILLDTWADVYPFNSYFSLARYAFDANGEINYYPDNRIHLFEWDHGSLFDMSISGNKVIRNEIMYVHFQKRRIKLPEAFYEEPKHYYVSPDIILGESAWSLKREIMRSQVKKICNIKRLKQRYKMKKYALRSNISNLVRKSKKNGI